MTEQIILDDNSIEEAVTQIMYIRQQIHALGGNDHEMPEIDRILEELRGDKITGEEAVIKANQLLESKQVFANS